LIDDRERIAISTGKIESAFGDGDAESILKVDPITSEYRVAAKGGLKSFLLWDCVSGCCRLNRFRIRRIKSNIGADRELGFGSA